MSTAPARRSKAVRTKVAIIALITLIIAAAMIATGDGSGASEITNAYGSTR